MSSNLFSEAKFNYGWELSQKIRLFENKYTIKVVADAYFETEEVTSEQNNSYKMFLENDSDIIRKIEEVLKAECGSAKAAIGRLVPSMILIKQNGDYGMVFDDKEDSENGLVVLICPDYQLMSTDEFF